MSADDPRRTHRVHRVQLANMRQELLAPVAAIVGYGELLHESAQRDGLNEMVPDLDRILSAARDLHGNLGQLERDVPAMADDLRSNLDQLLSNSANVCLWLRAAVRALSPVRPLYP